MSHNKKPKITKEDIKRIFDEASVRYGTTLAKLAEYEKKEIQSVTQK